MKTSLEQILREELTRRIDKNPKYSMRAFAKSLNINVGVLSGLLSGKRSLTAKTADQLCGRLGITPLEKSKIILATFHRSSDIQRTELNEDIFRAVADWYHWAILQLVNTESYLSDRKHSSPKWIARQIQITEAEAKLAVDRLLKLNLLTKNADGFFVRTMKSVTTENKSLTTPALKKWQKQIREKAIFSLEHDPIEIRSMTSMTMAIDPKKIEKAKKLIDVFQEEIAEFLESGSREQVYQLCVSLFPLQKRENKL